MFDALNRVRIYEAALKKLATGKYDNKDTLVHDYDTKCYRTDPKYTLNGLHWGYPRGIVYAVTKEDPEGTGWIGCHYATWATKKLRNHPNYGLGNSRYSIVKYSKIKKVVELGIQQKLDEAKKNAKGEKKTLLAWKRRVKSEYAKYANRTLRIESSKGQIDLIVIKPERFITRGFGTFLEKIKKGEVSISEKAVELLSRAPERGGLMGVEFFAGPIVAGLISEPELYGVPLEAISVSSTGFGQLQKLALVE
jgi:hypothetical protein